MCVDCKYIKKSQIRGIFKCLFHWYFFAGFIMNHNYIINGKKGEKRQEKENVKFLIDFVILSICIQSDDFAHLYNNLVEYNYKYTLLPTPSFLPSYNTPSTSPSYNTPSPTLCLPFLPSITTIAIEQRRKHRKNYQHFSYFIQFFF